MHFSWFSGYIITYFVRMNWLQLEKEWISALVSLYPELEARSLFFLMLKFRFGLDKTYYLLHLKEEVSGEQAIAAQDLLAQLKTGKPFQYCLGETEFCGLRVQVNASVLIPRPETEELVQWVSDELANRQTYSPIILDIGTGSGCIPIALKYRLPDAVLHAVDISEEALANAKQNAALNGVDVNFILLDIVESCQEPFQEPLDVIISNPPYVTFKERKLMHQNVLNFEPHIALFVPDKDPLVFYDRIADFAISNLKPDGILFFEINEQFGPKTIDLLKDKGFHSLELRQDLFGRDRMIKGMI